MAQNEISTDADFVRSALAASEDCIKVLSLDGRLTFMSEGGMRVMEVDDFSKIDGCPWPDFWSGEGNTQAKNAIAAAAEGRTARFIALADTMRGNSRWWDVQVSPILDSDGRPARILSVSRDITELKRAEERNLLLTQEMGHRVKNTLAMVQAIVGQTLRPAQSLEAGRTAVMERLAALGKAHDLLSQSSWSSASLATIIETTLAVHGSPSRFVRSGPDIELPPSRALAMALALHELAVNATKYGALATDDGLVTLVWTADDDGDFTLSWTESGGPAVIEPTRKGFGSSLLQRAVAAYFDGEARINYLPAGLVFDLRGRYRQAYDPAGAIAAR